MANQGQFPLAQRDAFLIPSGPGLAEDQCHLFVVLTDPAKNDSVLMVNATTIYANAPHDPTCILNVEDHHFIRRPSYILYSKARLARVQKIRQMIAAQEIIFRPPPISQPLFARIVAGIAPDGQMNPDHQTFFHQYK